nr:protease inhibitor 2-like [Penaeus vannamei]
MEPAVKIWPILFLLLGDVAAMMIYQGDGCLEKCPVTHHYSPVCGTDYVTYTNPSTLLCYKKCTDSTLGVAHFTSCVDWLTGNYRL